MNCRELSEFLMDYCNGDLPEESRVLFEAHLNKCGNCETYFVQYKVTIKAGQMACDDKGDEIKAIPEDLIKAVLAARAKA
jgi:predicted anti-sigma-YlaC factor YlaD